MLQTSGAISMSDVAVELGLAPTTTLTFDDSSVRKLAQLNTAGSAIALADLYGKANFDYTVIIGAYLISYYPVGVLSPNSPVIDMGGCVWCTSTNTADDFNGMTCYNSSGDVIASARNLAYDGWIDSGNFRLRRLASGSAYEVGIANISASQQTIYKIELVKSTGEVVELYKHRNFVLKASRRRAGDPIYVRNTYYPDTYMAPNYP